MALAAAMSCSMITGWANTAEIVSVTVTDSANNVEDVTAVTNFEVNPSDLVSVKVKIKDTTPAAIADAEATFLTALTDAFGEGKTLSDENIQYVDQQTTAVVEGDSDTEAYAVFTFRPRMQTVNEVTSLKLIGPHVAKVGGTAVTTVKDFAYTVKEADVVMTLTATPATVKVGKEITFTVTVPEGKVVPKTATVTITGVETAPTYADGTFTWSTETAGSYDVKVEADGYVAATTRVTVEADDVVVEPEHKDDVQDAVDKVVKDSNPTVEDGKAEVTLPETVQGGDVNYNVKYDVVSSAPEGKSGVTKEGNKITYAPTADSADVERVEVVATVGTGDAAPGSVSYIYFVKDDIGFGNVFAITDADGKDIFDGANAKVGTAVNSADIATARTKALSIVLGKAGTDSIAKANETLDYNRDGKYLLSEYYIIKRMLEAGDGEAIFTPAKVKAQRPAKN